MITHIIFDNNGVLTTSDHEQTYKKVSEYLKIPIEKIPGIFKKHVVNLDTGRIKQSEFYSLVLKDEKIDVSPEEFCKIHQSGYIKKNEVQKFAKNLKAKYNIALLSNFGSDFWKLYEHWGLDKIFEKENVFVSSDLGLAKPDKQIFLEALKRLKIRPESSVFIDDNKDNIKSASELGMNAIQFTNLKQLKKSLKKLRIN